MFTGIVTHVGRIVERRATAGGARARRRQRPAARRDRARRLGRALRRLPHRGRRRAGPLPRPGLAPRPWRAPRSAAGARATRVNLERSLRLGDELGGHLVFGHVDAVGEIAAHRAGRRELPARDRACPRALAPLRGGQGLDRGRRHLAHRQRGRPRPLRRHHHPAHLGAHHSGGPAGRAIAVNLEVDMLARYVARQLAFASAERLSVERLRRMAPEDVPSCPDRRDRRGRPRRPDVHPGRRRGPRERGRPRHPGPVLRRRRDQLHGQARPRPDLPGADRASAASSSACR